MTETNEIIYKKRAAVAAGISLIVMTIISIAGYGVINGQLFSASSPAASYHNLMGSPWLLNAEIYILTAILILDIIVAWALYVYLKKADKTLSLLGAWFRLAYSCMLGIGVACLAAVSVLVRGGAFTDAYSLEQIAAHIEFLYNSFELIWEIALVVFGLHLLLVGMLTKKSSFMPRWLTVLIYIASAGYLLVHSMYILFPGIDNITKIIEYVFMAPMTLAEFSLAVWLLAKGRNKAADA